MANGEPNLRDIDLPAMELFPALKPLLRFDGSEVAFKHGDKSYTIAAVDHETEDNPTVQNICIGIWETRDGKKIPVGFCDAWLNKLEDVVTVDGERHSRFENLPKEFRKLKNIEYTDWEIEVDLPGADAFIFDKKYRGIGLADVFQAQTIAIFQGLGAKEVVYVGDRTTHSYTEPGYIPQYKSTDGVSWEQPETSFYSKWSTSASVKKENGSHYTRIKPVLSGMQISLLRQSGL